MLSLHARIFAAIAVVCAVALIGVGMYSTRVTFLQVENMPPVRRAIPSIQLAALGEVSSHIVKARVRSIIDTVRPGVVSLHGNAITAPALNRKQQRVVAPCAAIVYLNEAAVVLPLIRVFQKQCPPLVGVGGRRARAIRSSGDHATAAGQINRRIALAGVQQVNDAVADVVSGYQPVCPDLPLDTEIPLVGVRRFQMQRHVEISSRSWKRDVGSGKDRERISSGISLPWIL